MVQSCRGGLETHARTKLRGGGAAARRLSTTCNRIFAPEIELCFKIEVTGAQSLGYLHAGQLAEDDVVVLVQVEHVDGRHLLGRAAGPGGAVQPGHLGGRK